MSIALAKPSWANSLIMCAAGSCLAAWATPLTPNGTVSLGALPGTVTAVPNSNDGRDIYIDLTDSQTLGDVSLFRAAYRAPTLSGAANAVRVIPTLSGGANTSPCTVIFEAPGVLGVAGRAHPAVSVSHTWSAADIASGASHDFAPPYCRYQIRAVLGPGSFTGSGGVTWRILPS